MELHDSRECLARPRGCVGSWVEEVDDQIAILHAHHVYRQIDVERCGKLEFVVHQKVDRTEACAKTMPHSARRWAAQDDAPTSGAA